MIVHLQLRIREIIQETPDCKTFIFENSDLLYKAGQFLTFIIPSGTSKIRRAYSFCTETQTDKFPGVTVKRVANGAASRYMLDVWQIGDTVECIQPAGKFTLDENAVGELILFAAGSGIVPLFSILKQALHSSKIEKIHLFYSNRSKESTIFYQQLIQLETQFPQKLTIKWFFSNSFQILEARINSDYIDDYFNTLKNRNKEQVHVFACGPESFMYLAEVRTLFSGIPKENYHQEVFYREESENHNPHEFKKGNFEVSIHKDGKNYSMLVPGNQTILSQAIKNNIPLPWSCAGGRCSTCMCNLESGKVYTSRNEVLTDRDLSKGYILTCTSYPEEGPISIVVE
ncbi:MAG: ferredoxin--NADP reductase [Bacteroidia bacterium]